MVLLGQGFIPPVESTSVATMAGESHWLLFIGGDGTGVGIGVGIGLDEYHEGIRIEGATDGAREDERKHGKEETEGTKGGRERGVGELGFAEGATEFTNELNARGAGLCTGESGILVGSRVKDGMMECGTRVLGP
jgi:hypothetical protein